MSDRTGARGRRGQREGTQAEVRELLVGVQWVFLGGFQAGVDHLSQTEVHASPSHLIKKWTLPIVTRGGL